ncbi:MAG: hypothetical protein ChlgKO_05880 [Chlamydiales bacterium]
MEPLAQKKPIVALHQDGETLEVTRLENGVFTSKKISGEAALQRLALDRLVKGATIITALSGKEVLFRRLEIPLKEKRAILKALPFQLESLIPYPPEQSIVLPQIGKKGKVKVFATQKESLRAHLDFWKKLFVQPEFVSAHYEALCAFAKHAGKKNVTLLHLGKKESLLVVVREGELENGLFLAMGCLSEKMQIKRELFRAEQFLGEDLPPMVVTGESHDEVGKSEEPFALTIGLALQESVQFIQPEQHLAKLKKRFFLCSTLVMLYLMVFSIVGRGIIRSKEQALQNREQELGLFCKKELGVTPLQLGKVKVGSALEKEGPQLSQFLSYLSQQEGIAINRVHYRLESYPTVEKPTTPYEVRVDLEFSAKTSELANRFYEKIRKQQKKVKWQRHENGYQITFSYA